MKAGKSIVQVAAGTSHHAFPPRAEVAKRIFDLACALVLAPLLVIPALVVAGAILLDSRGPFLFRQTRVGRGGKPFTIYKFRTMREDTGDLPSHLASRAQLTRLGGRLRKLKLDEIPQLINILRGDMSFVGPRPCLPSQSDLIDARSRLGVMRLRPGITGPAQVEGIDMSTPQRLATADAAYIVRWSFWRDLTLLWRTATGAGRGDAVNSLGAGD